MKRKNTENDPPSGNLHASFSYSSKKGCIVLTPDNPSMPLSDITNVTHHQNISQMSRVHNDLSQPFSNLTNLTPSRMQHMYHHKENNVTSLRPILPSPNSSARTNPVYPIDDMRHTVGRYKIPVVSNNQENGTSSAGSRTIRRSPLLPRSNNTVTLPTFLTQSSYTTPPSSKMRVPNLTSPDSVITRLQALSSSGLSNSTSPIPIEGSAQTTPPSQNSKLGQRMIISSVTNPIFGQSPGLQTLSFSGTSGLSSPNPINEFADTTPPSHNSKTAKRTVGRVTKLTIGESSGSAKNIRRRRKRNQNTVQQDISYDKPQAYWDIGEPNFVCPDCNARMWFDERNKKNAEPAEAKFSLCCMAGKVKIPLMREPPKELKDLILGVDPKSSHFKKNIRAYNMMFAFTSIGGKIDTSANRGGGPYNLKMGGQVIHWMGSLLPNDGGRPKFAQLYIYDTDNEVQNRMTVGRTNLTGNTLDETIVVSLKNMLDAKNRLVQTFRMAREKMNSEQPSTLNIKLIRKRSTDGRTYNLPTCSEIAALVVGDINDKNPERDIVVEYRTGELRRISETHPLYLPLQYPLLFPFGEDGFRDDISLSDSCVNGSAKRKKLTMREFLAFRIQDREGEFSTIVKAGRLFQQFLVDGYMMMESYRLGYIKGHQDNLRADLYQGLADAVLRGETNPTSQGKRVILPSSFTGGARYTIQNYQDAMAICKWAGYPDLFITFTCNPKWPEVVRFLEEHKMKVEDRPDILSRIFKIKLDRLIKDIKKNNFFGSVKAVIYTIEFQKRGLPHAHILVFLHSNYKYPAPADIDKVISAEIPDKDLHPELHDAVSNFMLHGPCGPSNYNSPCMVDGRCSKHFPKSFNAATTIDDDGYPRYRRADNGRFIEKKGVQLDNRYVIPYNPSLLTRYQAHINVEKCNQSRSIKYLFKYINKGHDRVTATFYESGNDSDPSKEKDEIKMYCDCRYISPCEAVWRTYAFDINFREPSVERLSFHLPGMQYVVFNDKQSIQNVVERNKMKNTMFTAWLEANNNEEYRSVTKDLTYSEFPNKFVFDHDEKLWRPRKKRFSIGRLYYVPPGAGELHYMRVLLNIVRGPKSFEDIRRIGERLYPTYREACYALGLLDDDREYVEGIAETSQWGTAPYLRKLFAMLLMSNSMSSPEFVWNNTWHMLSDDILYNQRRDLNNPNLILSDDQLKNYALIEIEKLLQGNGRSLTEFSTIPYPRMEDEMNLSNKLIQEEVSYNHDELHNEHAELVGLLNKDKKRVYDVVRDAVDSRKGGIFFVYGYGGTGKTFLWRTLSAAYRSEGKIVLNVASSGIASLLLPGGRTAHSRFRIPLNITEDSTCNINQGSELADLLIKTELIIWDEAPMMNKMCFEAVDRSLRDLMRFSNLNSASVPFGGKVVVLGGDFRQILPVIPKGTRQEIVFSTINSSYLWEFCTVLTLTENMRLSLPHLQNDKDAVKEFAKWILNIGEGNLDHDNHGESIVDIPDDLLVQVSGDPIASIVSATYPDLLNNLENSDYFQERAILAPRLKDVDSINDYMMSILPGEETVYLSSDSVCKADCSVESMDDLYTTDFLNSIKMSGVPNHVLKLKYGAPIMLLRNIDRSMGMCNGSRLIVKRLGRHVIEAAILEGDHAGKRITIPRMVLTPSDSKLPFKLKRRQFPIALSFAMSINKSQGQSLSSVGLFLGNPVFSHGQLYVAVSRVRKRSGLKILILDKDGKPTSSTANVVYREVFNNLSS